jgi:hypothetical protein
LSVEVPAKHATLLCCSYAFGDQAKLRGIKALHIANLRYPAKIKFFAG